MIFSMLLIFLLICVISTLGSLFSVQKRLNPVISSLDIILVYVIPYLNVFSPLHSFSDQKVRTAGSVELWAHHGLIKRNNYICSLILYLFLVLSSIPSVFLGPTDVFVESAAVTGSSHSGHRADSSEPVLAHIKLNCVSWCITAYLLTLHFGFHVILHYGAIYLCAFTASFSFHSFE